MASLRGNCIAACSQNNGSSCWHKDTIIRKQLTNGKWMLENKKGYIRLADEDMIIFDGGEYLKHKHTNLNNGNHMMDNEAILEAMMNTERKRKYKNG